MDGDLCSYYALIWNTINLVTFCLQHVKVVACEWLEKKRYGISDKSMRKSISQNSSQVSNGSLMLTPNVTEKQVTKFEECLTEG